MFPVAQCLLNLSLNRSQRRRVWFGHSSVGGYPDGADTHNTIRAQGHNCAIIVRGEAIAARQMWGGRIIQVKPNRIGKLLFLHHYRFLFYFRFYFRSPFAAMGLPSILLLRKPFVGAKTKRQAQTDP